MSSIYAIKRKLEAIRIHEHVNKPNRKIIWWQPDNGAGEPGFCVYDLDTHTKTPCAAPEVTETEDID